RAAWRTHREALDRWAASALHGGSSAEDVLAGLEADDALRVVAYLTLALGADAMIAAGRRVDLELRLPAAIPRDAGVTGTIRRAGQTIRTHMDPTSSVLHGSLRVAIGLALAVLLGQSLQLQHAFWVVLGTLSVLRSNALATGRSTVQALGGTVIGVAVGALFILAVGTATTVLWVILPIAVLLAAYAASAIGFVAGQAAFTFVVIILFSLIAPAGWQIGLVRVEDVAIGVAISLVVGLFLWPRGARDELRRALAELYYAVASDVAGAFERVLGQNAPTVSRQGNDVVAQARDRAGEAFGQYVRERNAKPLEPETGGSLLAAGNNAILAADLIDSLASAGYRTQSHDEPDVALQDQVRALVGVFARLADQLEHGVSAPTVGVGEGVDAAALRGTALVYLRRWKDNPAEGRAAIATVVTGEWIQRLATLSVNLEEPVAHVVEAARVPWWR
ncbi:MAG: FUSC family protein, partial [Ktedonobacterales bacterium]